MIIYNVTTKVHNSIAEEWLHWMQTEHMPEVMNCGCFTKSNLLRLLEVDDSEGPTYTVQYTAADMATYTRYLQDFSAVLRAKAIDRWEDKIIGFRSLMGTVQ
jgi:hypothetical protein